MDEAAPYRVCKRCLLEESGAADVLADIRRRIANIPPPDRTADAAYQARLDACRACDALIGGTCLKCGCYPELRAAFLRSRCPQKRWPR